MKFPMILPALTCLVALASASPMPQSWTSSGARRVPQSSTAVSIGSILISDLCLSSFFHPIFSIDSADKSDTASTYADPESLFGWLHNIWNNIRNAIKNVSIKITIPLNVLEDWLNKIAKCWAVQQDSYDSQTVGLILSADEAMAGAQMIKWKARIVVSRPPVNESGVTTAPGKPTKDCP